MNIKDILDVICKYVCNKDNKMINEKRLCPNKECFFMIYEFSDGKKRMECNFKKGELCLKDNQPCEFHNYYTQESKKSPFYTILNLILFAFAIYGIYKFFS